MEEQSRAQCVKWQHLVKITSYSKDINHTFRMHHHLSILNNVFMWVGFSLHTTNSHTHAHPTHIQTHTRTHTHTHTHITHHRHPYSQRHLLIITACFSVRVRVAFRLLPSATLFQSLFHIERVSHSFLSCANEPP